MMRWVIISENYLSYLRSVEPHIPNSEYGKYKFKPFFGVLFETDDLKYDEIETYRVFSSEKGKSQYIHFLKKEIKLINDLNVGVTAKRLYDLKNEYPENIIARRCIDFKELEKQAKKYETL